MNRPLVVGSVAFDIVFDVHGTINERIVLQNGKLGRQNLMFTAKERQEFFGGTGANIAYGLGLLHAHPILFSAVGRDFAPHFQKHLESNGVEPRVHVEKDNRTAAFYGFSDEQKEQIGVWHANAHDSLERISIVDTFGKKTLSDVSVAIFSGAPTVTLRHMKAARGLLGKKVKIIFDPGQMILFYSKKQLKQALSLADIFIVNDVELRQALGTLEGTVKDIFPRGPKAVIETRGASGSVLHEPNGATKIAAVKPRKVAEVTGAGDAYRAGLMYGLLRGKTLSEACRIGAILGARSVETAGGQTYKLSREEIQ
ncbi:hypothetical protein KGQ31_01995 [Patescibacteria group bacterium]|nr:hypothetical protein [Patescibacteria group bacterium]